jgi:subtilisin family serine protease
MRTTTRSLCMVLVLGASICVGSQVHEKRSSANSGYQTALRAGNVVALKKILPKVGDFYLVEGDLRLSESQLQRYVDAFSAGKMQQLSDKSIELRVNRTDSGEADYYKDPASRRLTYSIDRKSFPTEQMYTTAQTNMKAATDDWQSRCPECGIQFAYEPQSDSVASPDRTNFVVRWLNTHGSYIAAAFFPSDPPARRYIDLDPSYFQSMPFNAIGVLRHELGHVLGYRHEHIVGIPGCYMEDDRWMPLTDYDSKSVMHYYCGGKGTLTLELTEIDVQGHRQLYAPAPATAASIPPSDIAALSEVKTATLKIRFEGGEVSKNVAEVLRLLWSKKLLATKQYTVKPGDNVSDIFVSTLNLPGAAKELTQLATEINGRKLDSTTLQINQQLRVPNIEVRPYSFSKEFTDNEKGRLHAEQKNWGSLISGEPAQKSERTRVSYVGFELRIEGLPLGTAMNALNAIDKLPIDNVFPTVVKPLVSNKAGPYFAHNKIPLSQFMPMYRERKLAATGSEANLSDLLMTDSSPCTGANQTIVLIDQPVYQHPEFCRPAANSDVRREGPSCSSVVSDPSEFNGTPLEMESRRFDPKIDHGTHMAGILVAQENGFGLVGIAPDARVKTYNWDVLGNDATKIADAIEDQTAAGFPIFVFANSWRESEMKPLSTRIEGLRPLLIVAAGPEAGRGHDLSQRNALSPVDLGQNDYVVVVTACENCFAERARLDTDSNFSTAGLVHLAAPGNVIPSTIAGGGYDEVQGTSQATALVAGLVARMASCSTYYENSPSRIKYRLLLTANPNLEGEDFNRVVAGVVNANAALLSPQNHWSLEMTETGERYKEFSPTGWCQQYLDLRDDGGRSLPLVRSSDLKRIVKTSSSRWVFYTGEAEPHVKVTKIGPAVPTAAFVNGPLLKTSNGTLSLSQMKDIILAPGLRPTKCN